MDAETPLEIEKLNITADIITESFVASAGSAVAHELYIRGLAVKYNTDVSHIQRQMQGKILIMPPDEITTISRKMGQTHGRNVNAKESVSEAIDLTYNNSDPYRIALKNQIPTEIHTRDLRNQIFDLDLNKDVVDLVLLSIFDKKNTSLRLSRFKEFAAFLRLYNGKTWWIELSDKQQDEYINAGKTYYDVNYEAFTKNSLNSS
jgi:hypothetical protein